MPTLPAPDKYLGVPIEVLRQHAGYAATDATHDAEIDNAFAIAVQIVEAYLDRILAYGSYTETAQRFAGTTIHLKAYPVDLVDMVVSGSGIEPEYVVSKEIGVVYLSAFLRANDLSCSYEGGFITVPGAIQMALIGTYDNVWSSVSATTNVAAVGQEVRAMSMDGMKLEYQNFSGGSGSRSFGYIPAAMLPMIDPYRREFV